jgi:hypothetical protein
METFSEVREHILDEYELKIDEPFIIGFEVPMQQPGRLQSMYLAELQTSDGGRVLRVETTVAPLVDLDAEKCLRINLTQRVGYLAVGDLDGIPYIKMCENLPYGSLEAQLLDYVILQLANEADQMEQSLEPGDDIS